MEVNAFEIVFIDVTFHKKLVFRTNVPIKKLIENAYNRTSGERGKTYIFMLLYDN